MTKALERIHHPRRGFIAGDFLELKPNTLLVEAIDPPETLSSLFVPQAGSSLGLKSTRYLYRVVRVGPMRPELLAPGESLTRCEAHDVIVPRNCMFDPVGQNLFSLDARHVIAVVDPDIMHEGESAPAEEQAA